MEINALSAIHKIYFSEDPWYPVAVNKLAGELIIMESGYLEGVGNIGPRIMKVSGSEKSLLVEVEDFKPGSENPDRQGERQDQLNVSSNKIIGNWIVAGMCTILLIGVLMALSRLFGKH